MIVRREGEDDCKNRRARCRKGRERSGFKEVGENTGFSEVWERSECREWTGYGRETETVKRRGWNGQVIIIYPSLKSRSTFIRLWPRNRCVMAMSMH